MFEYKDEYDQDSPFFDFIDFQEMAVAASSANEDRAAMVRQKEEIRSLKEEKERNAQLEMKRVGNDCSVFSICSMRSQYMYHMYNR